MFLKNPIRAAVAALALGITGLASAEVVTLTFEGLGNRESVGDFYNGGTGSLGSSGVNYGVSFNDATMALIDSDAPGGTGSFANEPSASTVLFFKFDDIAILSKAAGFDTGFSFFYSSAVAATVDVYDGEGGTGNVLASLSLGAQYADSCSGDPSGTYCNWTAKGVSFSGVAKSIAFGGGANQTAFDNITFGSATPGGGGGGSVPEPTSLALVGAALLAAGAARRRKG